MSLTIAPTAIDLSRVPAPDAIEVVDQEAMFAAYVARFLEELAIERVKDPSIPDYDVDSLETDPFIIVAEALTSLRAQDRERVNYAVRSVLAPLAKGTNLDNVVARTNVIRLIVREATNDTPAVYEDDASLLRRYLLSFDRPSAGSRDRYLYEAWAAWPSGIDDAGARVGMGDCRVNGRAIHGRRGDTDVVIIGPGGRTATAEEKTMVRLAVTSDHVRPEAIYVRVVDADRVEYAVDLRIEIAPGPDPEIIRREAESRVIAGTKERILIGAEIPSGYLKGLAYGPNVIKVVDLAPVQIEPAPYAVPVAVSVSVNVEVRS